jgi:V/A-type H+-transporting ATPase subunit A
MDLPAIVANFYARAGYVTLPGGQSGSITFIGTVSPSGGSFKDPVVESTKKAARCFYALAQSRADSKRYPAVDPIDSYSKYLEYDEVIAQLDTSMEPGWVDKVLRLKDVLLRGREARDQISILGDDSVPIAYHVNFNKAEVIDFVILQQDAFDKIDTSTPLARQRYMVNLVLAVCDTNFAFDNFEQANDYFKAMINLLRQMNYQEFESPEFKKLLQRHDEMIASKRADARAAA